MIGNILLNLRYLFAPILIIVAGAGVLIGGMWAWTGVILLFVGLLVDIATKFETSGVGYDENGETRGWATFQNLTMYFMLPVFVLFQLVMAYRLYTFMALGGAEGAVVMELIPENYDEYTVDIYYDKFGELKSLVPRLRIETRAGEISKGLTSKGLVYVYLKDKLQSLKGARGCITLQIFFEPTKKLFKAIEINPRFGGGFPLSYSAGANFPKMLIKEYILDEKINFLEDWEDNLLMLRYDSKILQHDYKP